MVAALTTLILHFAWEMLQAPAFAEFAGRTWAAVGVAARAVAVVALEMWAEPLFRAFGAVRVLPE